MIVHLSLTLQRYIPLSEPTLNKAVRVALPILSALAFACLAYPFSPFTIALSLSASLLTTSLLVALCVTFLFEKVPPPKKALPLAEAEAFLRSAGFTLEPTFVFAEKKRITEKEAEALEVFLPSLPFLTRFTLRVSKIEEGVRLGIALQKCKGLTHLDLEWMTLNAKELLTQTPDFWQKLEGLSLFATRLEDEDAEALATLLPKMERLKTLDLRFTHLSTPSMQLLLSKINHNNLNNNFFIS